jgi:hypothetical protein
MNVHKSDELLDSRRRVALVSVLLASVCLVAAVVSFAGRLQQQDSLQARVETVQSVATTLGILVAGGWAFYVFFIGRTFAPSLQLDVSLKGVLSLSEHQNSRAALISIMVHNSGRTRVRKQVCFAGVMEVMDPQSGSSSLDSAQFASQGLVRLDDPFDPTRAIVDTIFVDQVLFEPGEKATEDILLYLADKTLLKIAVIFQVGGAWNAIAPRGFKIPDKYAYTILDTKVTDEELQV